MANRRGKVGSTDGFPLLEWYSHCNGDYNHEIKIWLLLGRKAMTNLDSVLKSRDVTLPTMVCIFKVFLVVKYACESWTTKMEEHHRIVVFELWC